MLTETKREWLRVLVQQDAKRKSELCKAKDIQSDWYKRWCAELNEEPRFHRKQWEYAYILQALWERGCIKKGKKGVGFAVGTEPLPSLFARYGCDVLATDIFPEKGVEKGWAGTNQLCTGLESLNRRGLCEEEVFRQHVRYQPADMNHLPADITNYDFNWSSCSFEHLGSIKRGLDFLQNQLQTLKPGGWAVHTTEYNISSNDLTLDHADTVVFRMKDLEALAGRLRRAGHYVEEFDYSLGGLEEDFRVDILPHQQDVHLKLQLNEFIVTSVGIIIQKRKKMFSFFTA